MAGGGKRAIHQEGQLQKHCAPSRNLWPELPPAAKAHSCHQTFAEEGLDSVPCPGCDSLLRASPASQATSDA